MKFIRSLTVTIAVAATSGCANLPAVVKALAKDPATVTVKFSGYGTQFDFTRTNPGFQYAIPPFDPLKNLYPQTPATSRK